MIARPSHPATRICYAIAALLVGLPLAALGLSSLLLLVRMASDPPLVNPLVAIISICIGVVVAIVLVWRLWSLATGKCKLEVITLHGALCWLRRAALTLMIIGIVAYVISRLYVLMPDVSTMVIVASAFTAFIPVGLVLFEFSRLLERE